MVHNGRGRIDGAIAGDGVVVVVVYNNRLKSKEFALLLVAQDGRHVGGRGGEGGSVAEDDGSEPHGVDRRGVQ